MAVYCNRDETGGSQIPLSEKRLPSRRKAPFGWMDGFLVSAVSEGYKRDGRPRYVRGAWRLGGRMGGKETSRSVLRALGVSTHLNK